MHDRSSKITRTRERGSAMVLFAIMLLLVILPMIGLCIDGGVTYFAHSRLTAAVDAAALAGARSLNVGLDFDSQKANAQKIAIQYLHANFPDGFLNSSPLQWPAEWPEVYQSDSRTITVAMQASTDVQLYFMGILGHPSVHLTASATTARRDANVMLVLDRSGSMGSACTVLKQDAQNFVSQFVDGRDQVGLITFMGTANLDFPPAKNFKSQKPSLIDTLQQLKCSNNTGSADALWMAHDQITNYIKEPSADNVIVFFTDGYPNGFSGHFPIISSPGKTCDGYIAEGGGLYDLKPLPISSIAAPTYTLGCSHGALSQLGKYYTVPDTDIHGASAYGYSYKSGPLTFNMSDTLSMNAAEDAALQARRDGIQIYAIGLHGDGGIDDSFLERVANIPTSATYDSTLPVGKYYPTPNAGQLNAAFMSIASDILRISR